jgi:eukaryotic-like serine/threonine-protein kinase
MLNPGMKLGPYEILSPLGAGGMGEVYRAHDSKLGRDVALKVLPARLAADAQRMARFAREAQVLASLNHPNIAAIYGLEESRGVRALVMELVEGQTLAERLSFQLAPASARHSRGSGNPAVPASAGTTAAMKGSPLQLDEALPIAKQIAEALEAAHDRGIVHRDLKPANVKITPAGMVKVLDFGLAKAFEFEDSPTNVANSPTLSVAATQAGVILGTAAYMSPEQARGKAVDRRADIWAFGCVLFEMLCGEQSFEGETVSDTLAAVIRAEPEWDSLPAATPIAIQRLIRRCLTKDPKQRLQAIGEARIVIEETLSGSHPGAIHDSLVGAGLKPAPTVATWRRVLPWTVGAVLLGAAIFFAVLYLRQSQAPTRAILTQILPPPKSNFVVDSVVTVNPELSPDGDRMVYLAGEPGGKPRLWTRWLDSPQAKPLEGTEDGTAPFWSPDGRYIGFFAEGKLKKLDSSGGSPLDLASAPVGRGGSWGADGTILFAAGINTPIYRVSAAGGTPVVVTAFDKSRQESSHRWPQFLPDNQHFLYYAVSASPDYSGTYVGSLAGGEPKLLLRGESNAIFAPPGFLLFVRGTTLMAQPFDPSRLELSGDSAAIGENVTVLHPAWRSVVSASRNAIVGYWTGASAGGRQILWFDRKGKQVATTGSTDIFQDPRLSPNGKELAITIGSLGGNPDIWVYDLARGARTRLTFEPSVERSPVWSPDGTRIAFASTRNLPLHIYEKAANGTGTTQPLLEDDAREIPDSWSSDGRYIAYERQNFQGKIEWDIWILPTFGDKKPFPFLQSQFNETQAAFSPDSKWLAYTSDESGTEGVYIVPFPQGNGKWGVSTNGGSEPRWRGDGKELFFISPDQKLMAVDILERGSSLQIGNPQPLFRANFSAVPGVVYDVASDGKKFVTLSPAEQVSTEPITLVVNWTALVKRQ